MQELAFIGQLYLRVRNRLLETCVGVYGRCGVKSGRCFKQCPLFLKMLYKLREQK